MSTQIAGNPAHKRGDLLIRRVRINDTLTPKRGRSHLPPLRVLMVHRPDQMLRVTELGFDDEWKGTRVRRLRELLKDYRLGGQA